ncbi:MAG: hypothetical protein ACRDIZ_00800 [Actinomycetota bacterium]
MAGLMNSRPAISALESPSATRPTNGQMDEDEYRKRLRVLREG